MLFIENDGENLNVYNGATGPEDLILSANHDEHGWSGIGLLESAVNVISDIYNIEVHYV